jgi:hypothetical protein
MNQACYFDDVLYLEDRRGDDSRGAESIYAILLMESQRNSSHLWMVQLPVHKSVQSLSSSQRGRLGATFLTSGQVGRLEPGL